MSAHPEAPPLRREWQVMVVLLSALVILLYLQAHASRARLLKLNREAQEFSDYFKSIKPRYDTAYAICEELSRMAPRDSDAARILQKNGVQIRYDARPKQP